ncbi:MAG: hypothetical protein MJ000_01600 [Bacteroidales bacterium]|nr:hypothetical protein [Bacteroidales bacterium]MCQ2308867.1 hypothetical protein [Bacteroidales bacterium]
MKNKKFLLTISMIFAFTTVVATLSSFTTPKQDVKSECSQIKADDDWMLFRENVPYCDVDTQTCEGYGYVWVNKANYQIAFSITKTGKKYDLAEYTGKDGYNMRFWYNSKYHYVNIYVPSSVFN